MTKELSKREANKKAKEHKLLQAASDLFMEKGIQHTSVDDIVKRAQVAKGTYYLYFKDKSAIEERLIARESTKILSLAVEAAGSKGFESFQDEFIYAVDYIINYLETNKAIMTFIKKDLSYAIYSLSLEKEDDRIRNLLGHLQEAYTAHLNPELLEEAKTVIGLCIEFLGAAIYSSLVYEKPQPLADIRSYLHRIIRLILSDYGVQ